MTRKKWQTEYDRLVAGREMFEQGPLALPGAPPASGDHDPEDHDERLARGAEVIERAKVDYDAVQAEIDAFVASNPPPE